MEILTVVERVEGKRLLLYRLSLDSNEKVLSYSLVTFEIAGNDLEYLLKHLPPLSDEQAATLKELTKGKVIPAVAST